MGLACCSLPKQDDDAKQDDDPRTRTIKCAEIGFFITFFLRGKRMRGEQTKRRMYRI